MRWRLKYAMVGMWDIEIEVKIISVVGKRVSKIITEKLWFFDKKKN